MLLAALAIVVAGCAFAPTRNLRLEEAMSAFRQIASDSRVELRAPAELQRAKEALYDAIAARNTLADPALVDHLAYLAKQRTAIAYERARQRSEKIAENHLSNVRVDIPAH